MWHTSAQVDLWDPTWNASLAQLMTRGTKEKDCQRAVIEHQIWMQMLALMQISFLALVLLFIFYCALHLYLEKKEKSDS